MNSSKNEKNFEELSNEALDKVAGGWDEDEVLEAGPWVAKAPLTDDERYGDHECGNCHRRHINASNGMLRDDNVWFCNSCWYTISGW